MITRQNFEQVVQFLGFTQNGTTGVYEKRYDAFDYVITINFKVEKIEYTSGTNPIRVNDQTTSNFSHPENFVVLECVNRLLEKGYRPEHIELEKKWTLGHEEKGGKADICVYSSDGKMLFIIECKTYGKEYKKEYDKTCTDGGQLFSYWQQEGSTKWLALYAADYVDGKILYITDSIDCSDDANILSLAKKDTSIATYSSAHTKTELHTVWTETYDRRFCGDVIFRDDSQAYQIGVKPLRKRDLRDFSEGDKIVNRFEEILRHNNVSDKENAFNRLIALFICKLVDEIQKTDVDVVDFQYKVGTDTYESLQDRLQRLHKEGMEKFMREEIFYVSDDYADNLVQQYTGQKRKNMIAELKKTLRILKFYTNNDFTFKDVHNEELFYQNGKILVEVVQLFQEYRIIGSKDLQMLGDLFEQLLNKGFKQNEGQFFTPTPITRFIWDSLPVKSIVQSTKGIEYPKIIDYACGAGHFLTEGFEAINACVLTISPETEIEPSWVEKKVYGVEKDYRLARVSKISLFMHGAGDGNIIFGDGLENYPDKSIIPNSFDILVANPPYSVAAFKPHLKLKDNELTILEKISNNGSEIETLFIERIAQLLKPKGIAAVILPSSILNKESESFIAARENLLRRFNIRAIAQLGSKTFGATGTNTVILFLEKFDEPPKRTDLVADSVTAIFENGDLDDWEDKAILDGYLAKIGVDLDTYRVFVGAGLNYLDWESNPYFKMYLDAFLASAEVATKIKQKGFIKATQAEKERWLNQHFYAFAKNKEAEKLIYYALVYLQNTLVITAPDGNKEQEEFLGYKWSNRKGQEGIQIITPGGLLYNVTDRSDDGVLAGIIRNAYVGNACAVPELSDYYYYLRLQDMLDFGNVEFNKAIKTTKTRVPRTGDGWTVYKLSDDKVFDVFIGDRVLSTEVEESGKYPIYSANVFEEFGRTNKQNVTDFSQPSIVWGIDGDWMVNCIPADEPFYPTDHCGVLRIHSDQLVPGYIALALQVEGEFERFSRQNRASTQRIKNLVISVPVRSIQEQILGEINVVDAKILGEKRKITDLTELLWKKYAELFSQAKMTDTPLPKLADYFIGLTYSPENISKQGTIVLRSGNIQDSSIDLDNLVRVDMDIKEDLLVKQNDILMCSRNGSANLVGKVAIISDLPETMTFGTFMTIIRSPYYSYLWQYFQTDHFRNQISGGRTMSINQITTAMLDKIIVPMPEDKLVEVFTEFLVTLEKEKQKARKRLEAYCREKEELLTKYFR